MSVLVSVRNTDRKFTIRVIAAPYYNLVGVLVGDYLPTPRTVGPFETLELFVDNREKEGGSGASLEGLAESRLMDRSRRARTNSLLTALECDQDGNAKQVQWD